MSWAADMAQQDRAAFRTWVSGWSDHELLFALELFGAPLPRRVNVPALLNEIAAERAHRV